MVVLGAEKPNFTLVASGRGAEVYSLCFGAPRSVCDVYSLIYGKKERNTGRASAIVKQLFSSGFLEQVAVPQRWPKYQANLAPIFQEFDYLKIPLTESDRKLIFSLFLTIAKPPAPQLPIHSHGHRPKKTIPAQAPEATTPATAQPSNTASLSSSEYNPASTGVQQEQASFPQNLSSSNQSLPQQSNLILSSSQPPQTQAQSKLGSSSVHPLSLAQKPPKARPDYPAKPVFAQTVAFESFRICQPPTSTLPEIQKKFLSSLLFFGSYFAVNTERALSKPLVSRGLQAIRARLEDQKGASLAELAATAPLPVLAAAICLEDRTRALEGTQPLDLFTAKIAGLAFGPPAALEYAKELAESL